MKSKQLYSHDKTCSNLPLIQACRPGLLFKQSHQAKHSAFHPELRVTVKRIESVIPSKSSSGPLINRALWHYTRFDFAGKNGFITLFDTLSTAILFTQNILDLTMGATNVENTMKRNGNNFHEY